MSQELFTQITKYINTKTKDLDQEEKYALFRQLRDHFVDATKQERPLVEVHGAKFQPGSVNHLIVQRLEKGPTTVSQLMLFVSRERGKKVRYQQIRQSCIQLLERGLIEEVEGTEKKTYRLANS